MGEHALPGYSPEVNEILSYARGLSVFDERIRWLRTLPPISQGQLFFQTAKTAMEWGAGYETRYAPGQILFTAADYLELTKAILEVVSNG